MKSYYHAHESAYREIKAKGGIGWGGAKTLKELGDETTMSFLRGAIAELLPNPVGMPALDLGCGSGTTAFILAKLGFDVTGIDVSETAIELANELALQQKLAIQFVVGDILQLEKMQKKFGLIYDSHCLHCIVFDEDRAQVWNGIKNSLSHDGVFVLDTMITSENFNPVKGFPTLRLDENYILWHKAAKSEVRGTEMIDGQIWCAQRRIYPKQKLLEELLAAGFKILSERTDPGSEGNAAMLRVVATHR